MRFYASGRRTAIASEFVIRCVQVYKKRSSIELRTSNVNSSSGILMRFHASGRNIVIAGETLVSVVYKKRSCMEL